MTATNGDLTDPFAASRPKLFPGLENRLLKKAADALAGNDPAAAESILAQFLRKQPDAPDALNLMADVARRAGRLDEAETCSARSVAISPQHAGYRFNYAVILRRRMRHEEAVAQLDILL